ncbi:hypothetical protein TIFTF001_020410 [Ficus carica]|uniref:Uncharacterized protein n=1 Tax=Ficus carica TaxID=3494 RepID=A0AA88AG06_FICCA|nr:hypothetical protein TIFTF001_020410 [Ficus carica]
MADMEMVDRTGGRPVYTVCYFTSAVTPEFLESLREEFQILGNIELVVSGPNDLPSCSPPGHIISRVFSSRPQLAIPPLFRQLPFSMFDNLYRMKSAPLSTGSYYFQGYQGTIISGCPYSNKNHKHPWLYATGEWLSGRENYD